MSKRRQDSEDDSDEGETLLDTDAMMRIPMTPMMIPQGLWKISLQEKTSSLSQSKNQKRYQDLIIHAVYNSFNKTNKCSIEASNGIEERTTNCAR